MSAIAYANVCTFCRKVIKSRMELLFFFLVVEEGKSINDSSNGVHKSQFEDNLDMNHPALTYSAFLDEIEGGIEVSDERRGGLNKSE